jgi:hypothetical protein
VCPASRLIEPSKQLTNLVGCTALSFRRYAQLARQLAQTASELIVKEVSLESSDVVFQIEQH